MRSDSKKICLPAKGQTFCPTGLSKQYDSEYPDELEDKVHPELFFAIMLEINEGLSLYWPCTFCWMFSHIMAIFTCGISLIFPWCCVSHAEERLKDNIFDANYELGKRGVRLHFRRKMCRTWLELEIFEEVEGEDIEMGRLLRSERERLEKKRERDRYEADGFYKQLQMRETGNLESERTEFGIQMVEEGSRQGGVSGGVKET